MSEKSDNFQGWPLVLAVAIATTTLASGCVVAGREKFVETSTSRLQMAPQSRVVVENARGVLQLVEGDAEMVEIEATKRVKARSQSRAREIAQDIDVAVVRDGDDFKVVVDYPSAIRDYHSHTIVLGFEVGRPSGAVDMVLTLPRGTPVKVLTRSGDLTLDSFHGRLDFESSSGDIHMDEFIGDVIVTSKSGDVFVSSVEGGLKMLTSSGDLSVRSITGDLEYDATSGDIDAGRVEGDFLVTTASGDVDATSIDGEVRVRTTSGDIFTRSVGGVLEAATASGDVFARLSQPLEDVYVRTSSGDVRLILTDPLRGRLSVSTSSGEIEARMPISPETVSRTRLVGVLGPGDATLVVKTSSGDVELLHDDQL